MKRLILAAALVLGTMSNAHAVYPCYPNRPVTLASNLYLSPTYLQTWWNNNFVPPNVANPHYYVAFHATDQYCKANYGLSAWAGITGPYPLTNTTNGTIHGGVYFYCQKCAGVVAVPVPVDPVKE